MSNVVPLVPGAPVVPIPALCRFCDGPLPAGRFVYCGDVCKKKWRSRSRNAKVPAVCEHCKKDCLVWASASGDKRGRFCSPKCGSDFARESGMFKGANNPRWLGGVSKDNMRYRRRQAAKWPERERSRRLVLDAVRSGKLVRRPCEVCSATERIEAHHDDYSKALEVRWLCSTHHDEHHARERARTRAASRPPSPVTRPVRPPAPVSAPARVATFWWRGRRRSA